MPGRYWLETLGCPKNQVDSDKLAGALAAEGYVAAADPSDADLVVVNTCAFVEAAREESVDTILALADGRAPGARLVVTGCMAERYGEELAAALPEVDLVAGFGQPVAPGSAAHPSPAAGRHLAPRLAPRPATVEVHVHVPAEPAVGTPAELSTRTPAEPSTRTPAEPAAGIPGGDVTPGGRARPGPRRRAALAVRPTPAFDLLELPRPAASGPWAYLKVAEGCDRRCGFCAIPSFRGPQRSRSAESILREVDALGPEVAEVVLVAQDLASWGLDRQARARSPRGPGDPPTAPARRGADRPLVGLVRTLSQRVERVRLLYLYPSSLDDALVEAIVDSGVAYFDLSLQHVSAPLVKAMRRWGDGQRFLDRIASIRRAAPQAALRSSFILGYPGETEEDHDELLQFLDAAQLDWAGFFTFSEEQGTHAARLSGAVPPELALQRLRECAELQDAITEAKRRELVGQQLEVLVDRPGSARSWREAPDIDGIVHVPADLAVGSVQRVQVTAAAGPDVWAELCDVR
ncbi:MAG: radical SAM protein [Actinomycetota bacterium]|nr:radical SAM protein [Actinomycetota bacterium]